MKRAMALLLALAMLLGATALAETMAVGDRGEAVKTAQQRLVETGYLSGGADGIYGEKTAAAVALFQYLNGLEPTGELDAQAATLLLSDDARTLRATLQTGDKGDAVQALQERLLLFGFLNGRADGAYGEKTAAAVKAFQNHLAQQGIAVDEVYGVAADGVATGLTQEYLFSGTYSTYLTTLYPGDTGDEVLRVERRLAGLGYLDAVPDEDYDDYAARALSAFCADAGLEAVDAVDRAAIDALFAEDAPVAARFVLHDVAAGDDNGVTTLLRGALIRMGFMTGLDQGAFDDGVTQALARLAEAMVARGEDIAPLGDGTSLDVRALETLLDGDGMGYVADVTTGADEIETRRVQRRLCSLMYLTEDQIDGKFGPATASAISEFQTNNDLEATGVADRATQEALFSDDPVGDWTPYMLEVRIGEQRVYVYQLNDQNRYEELGSFICSTGLGDSTPLGVFTDTTPINRWHWFEKFQCWAQYSYRITGNILFHSVLYSEKDTRTLRVNSVYALGSKASHGCVRLEVEAAKWIYENCERGTIVRVVE